MAQNKGIKIHQYLDDWLVRAAFHQTCVRHTPTLEVLCRQLNWIAKSVLEPKQIFNFVGYEYDLREGKVRPILEH